MQINIIFYMKKQKIILGRWNEINNRGDLWKGACRVWKLKIFSPSYQFHYYKVWIELKVFITQENTNEDKSVTEAGLTKATRWFNAFLRRLWLVFSSIS